MKYDMMFTKNCYFCGNQYTVGVLYRKEDEPKSKAVKMRLCKKHFEEMKLD